MQVPLEVVGEIEALTAGQAVRVTARKTTITIDLPNLRVGMMAFRGTGGRKQRAKTISRVNTLLHRTDLTVEFQLAGGTFALLGAKARPGLLSRLFGIAPVEIRLSGIFSLVRTIRR